MKKVAVILILVLGAIGALHLYWGLGGRWPGRDEADLVSRVVGTREPTMPGLLPSAIVASLLFAAALLAALQSGILGLDVPPTLRIAVSTGYWIAGAVFLARGAAAYIPSVFRYADGTPFATLNLVLYGPLCLAIGAAFVFVGLWGRA